MLNCFGFNNENCCLYILIILLLLCVCKSGYLNGIIDKICGCGALLPLAILLLCYCNKKPCPKPFSGGGCVCK